MTAALNFYKRKSKFDLLAMQEVIHADPVCKNLTCGIKLYMPKARKKLADIVLAISYHLTTIGKPPKRLSQANFRKSGEFLRRCRGNRALPAVGRLWYPKFGRTRH